MKKVIVLLKDESVDREEVTASIENALNGDRKVICVNANIISDIKLIDVPSKEVTDIHKVKEDIICRVSGKDLIFVLDRNKRQS